MNNPVAPEHMIVEAYERIIGLILRDSHLIGNDTIEINIFVDTNSNPSLYASECLTFKFRRTLMSYLMVGVHKIN